MGSLGAQVARLDGAGAPHPSERGRVPQALGNEAALRLHLDFPDWPNRVPLDRMNVRAKKALVPPSVKCRA